MLDKILCCVNACQSCHFLLRNSTKNTLEKCDVFGNETMFNYVDLCQKSIHYFVSI